MPTAMPALSLAAAAGRRKATIELAQRIEAAGFSGVYLASFGDSMGLGLSVAHATTTLRIGTSILPIYFRTPFDLAQSASYLHEISDGRFTLGLGVSHAPSNARLGVQTGRPLSDMRNYVERLRAAEAQVGPLPPIVLATLRKKMVQLAVEIADGAVWANASQSHMAASLAPVPKERIDAGFFVGNMIPTVIDDDRAAARAVVQRSLTGYLNLPNYRNYWKEAGYAEEMAAVKQALEAGDRDRLPSLMTDRWLADTALFGSVAEVHEGVERWQAAGVSTPILVPSSTKGGQFKAFEEIIAAFR